MSGNCKCCGIGRLPSLDRLAVLGVAIGFAVLVITGVPAVFRHGLTGYWLLAHTSGGGLFAVSLALLAFTRAGAGYGLLHKFFFWLLLTMGFGLILSAVLMMLPLLDTEKMRWLVCQHRRMSYIAIFAGLFYCWFSCRQCREA